MKRLLYIFFIAVVTALLLAPAVASADGANAGAEPAPDPERELVDGFIALGPIGEPEGDFFDEVDGTSGEPVDESVSESVYEEVYQIPDPEVWDVLVVGSDPEGIAAAVSAARQGLTVALVDGRSRVGGLYTLGALNMLDLNFKYPGGSEIIHTGFFAEFHRAMKNRAAFDIDRAERWFEHVLAEAGVRVFLKHEFVAPLKDGRTVTGIVAAHEGGEREFKALRVIDATQDAEVAVKAGARYRKGREEFGKPDEYAAATLVFALEGVDWWEACRYLRESGDPGMGFTNWSAWGFPQMYDYRSRDARVQMRGLNLGRQEDGTVVVNALQIFDVDPLNPDSRRKAMERAKAELPMILFHMRLKCPGFVGARLVWTADELYIRESRRIIGEKTLTAEDVFESRFPADTVALGSYPIDLQAARRGQQGAALSGTKPYGIPFGVLVPKNVENLLVVGKAASFDIIAHGSARTVPVGMATGQAAGVAAAYSIENDRSFREMSGSLRMIGEVREMLEEQGVDLTPVEVDYPEREHWCYPYIQQLRGKGLLSKGYGNDYRLDEPASIPHLAGTVLLLANYHTNRNYNVSLVDAYPEESTAADWQRLAAEILRAKERSFEELYNARVLDAKTYRHLADVSDEDELTHAQAYALLANILL